MKIGRLWGIATLSSVSLSAGIFTALHGKLDKLDVAFTAPRFWIAVSFSSAVCALLILYIYWISNLLDKRYGWQLSALKTRIPLQVGLGVVVPAAADLTLMVIYFHFLGTDVYETGFMMSEYHGVVLFIFIINLTLLIIHVWPVDKSEKIILTIRSGKVNVDLRASDILYFCLINRKMFVVAMNDEYATWDTLSNVRKQVGESDFMQINRSVIINPMIIQGYRKNEMDKIEIIVLPEYEKLLKHRPNDVFIVTADHFLNLKERFRRISD